MGRPSSIEREDEEIREEIAKARAHGMTIDEILALLREGYGKDFSRSAMGRHCQKLDRLGQKARRSRMVAEALARQMGDASVSRMLRANVEMMHTAILDLFMAGEDEDGKPNADGLAALQGNPEGLMLLSKALDHLTKASKTDADFVAQIEERTEARLRREAETNIRREGKKQGLTAEQVAALSAGMFGVKK
ncbi:DUF3486 family protein [Gluconacetobacter entanii]|uniref:phage protein Gp27 family protein n=1 Tax=Gluconacetobacter entanii TaxID=108528 RepID=UPI001C936A32|nr:phage protein Gp27 family protein [Gluconacetobacter entanii]MBY4640303.1 DUF3486 family protein [Gluconacetobacter entanii]MCW4579923.1 DUF3486 family protein [Gluconacetobacter entanii]MCW4584636.1 DUF3486 family protein [Gluconacetobacter entanii]MCW4588102.1 DUF3486 family protein [Gluconacetobacter entanii]